MSLLPSLLESNTTNSASRNEIVEFVRRTSVNGRIRPLRKERQVKLSTLAAAIGVSEPTMSRYLDEAAPDVEMACALRLFQELGVHYVDAWGFILIAEVTRSLLDVNPRSLPDDDQANIKNTIDALVKGQDPEELLLDLRRISGWSIEGARYAAAVCLLNELTSRTEALAVWFYGCMSQDVNRCDTAATAYDASLRMGLPDTQALWTECSRAQLYQETGNFTKAWGLFYGIRKQFSKKMDSMARLYVGLFSTIAAVHGFDDWLTDEDEANELLRNLSQAEKSALEFETDQNPAKRRTWWLHILRVYRNYIGARRDPAVPLNEMTTAISALEDMTGVGRYKSTVQARAENQLPHAYMVIAHISALRGDTVQAKKYFTMGSDMAKQQNHHFVLDFAKRIQPLIPLLIIFAIWMANIGQALAGDSCGKGF